jgi:hypothetical protein
LARWTIATDRLEARPGVRGVVRHDSDTATFAAVLRGLREDSELRSRLCDALAATPYEGIRWETPGVRHHTLERPFEFVVLAAPELVRRPAPEPFREHFVPGADVVEFQNLGHDAVLIAPCPRAPLHACGHLAAFMREAPAAQKDALWRQVGDAMGRRVGERPVWLNTAGGGVDWLHVRLDDRPKYYGYRPYQAVP